MPEAPKITETEGVETWDYKKIRFLPRAKRAFEYHYQKGGANVSAHIDEIITREVYAIEERHPELIEK